MIQNSAGLFALIDITMRQGSRNGESTSSGEPNFRSNQVIRRREIGTIILN